MFLAGWKPQNHGIYDVFFASGSQKARYLQRFFGQTPSKNTGIYGGFTM